MRFHLLPFAALMLLGLALSGLSIDVAVDPTGDGAASTVPTFGVLEPVQLLCHSLGVRLGLPSLALSARRGSGHQRASVGRELRLGQPVAPRDHPQRPHRLCLLGLLR